MSPISLVLLASLLASVAMMVNRARQRRFSESEEGQKSALDNAERAKSMLRDGERLVVADSIPNRNDFVLLTDRRFYYQSHKGKVFEADYAHIDKLKLADMTGSKVKDPSRAAQAKIKFTSGEKCTLYYSFPRFGEIAAELARRAG